MTANFRPAKVADTFLILQLYQKSADNLLRDPMFLDHSKISAALQDDLQIWMVQESADDLSGLIVASVDKEQGLVKITRWYQLDSSEESTPSHSIAFLGAFIDYCRPFADVVFLTNRYLQFQQMEATVAAGFKCLGFFPVSMLGRAQNPAALYALYKPGVIEQRNASYKLHPMLVPFFEVLEKLLGLQKMPALSRTEVLQMTGQAARNLSDPQPGSDHTLSLELIEAPRFAAARFERLRQQSLLSTDFYPFQIPNSLITDPDGEIEVYVANHPQFDFAAVIEERFARAVHPVHVYSQVTRLLHEKHLGYIETIIDASDVVGIEFLLQAGFTPILLFPSMKVQGSRRRDFVVLGHTYEKLLFCLDGILEKYQDFLNLYSNLEMNLIRYHAGKH